LIWWYLRDGIDYFLKISRWVVQSPLTATGNL
jgi:hypothetical protein